MRCIQPLLTKRIVHVVSAAAVRRQRRPLTHTRTGNAPAALGSSRIRRSGHRVQAIQERRVLVAGHSREPVPRETALATTVRRTHSLGTSRRLPFRAARKTATASTCIRHRIDKPSLRKGRALHSDKDSTAHLIRAGTQTTRCARVRCLRCGVRRHTSCLGAVPRRRREIEFDAHSSAVSFVTRVRRCAIRRRGAVAGHHQQPM